MKTEKLPELQHKRKCPPKPVTNHLKTTSVLLVCILSGLVALAQEMTITGKLLNSENEQAIGGASVTAKGTSIRTQTDDSGSFSIKVPGHVKSLLFSYVGYNTQEVGFTDNTEMEVRMVNNASVLSDVVVSGYSVQSKKDFTGASSRIKAVQLENKPVQSFDQALGGLAPGLNVIQPSGMLNNAPIIRIRGINSISSGIYPLIIIDGVAAFTGMVGGTVGNNPLADINPNDIESIDILKDASATAIYGSRAANGAMVITTKKGKKGKAKVTYDGWVGASQAINLPKLLDAYQYTDIKNEAMLNAGKEPGFALQTLSDGTVVNTDWYDVAYHTGFSQNHNVSLSGASDATRYYFSMAYTDQDGIVRTNTFKHKVARMNIEHKLFENFTIGANFSYSNSYNAGPNSGSLPGQYIGTAAMTRMTYILPPNVPVYKEDGSYNIQDNVRVGYGANNADAASPGYVGTLNAYNLQLILDQDKYSSESNSITSNTYAEWSFFKGFKVKTSYGLNLLNVENLAFQNPFHGDSGPAKGLATNTHSKFLRSDWTNTLSYSTAIDDKHHISALAGYEEIFTTVDGWGARESNITDPYFTSYQGGFTTIAAFGNTQGQNGFKSFFGNVNYDFARKYLFSFSFRRDGYSGLADGNKYGNFSGGSIGWNISEEDFFRNSSIYNIVSSLKIRASYGEVGNINIGDFPSLGLYGPATYNGLATLGFTQAGNSSLQWETSKKSDVGLNIGFLNDRFTLEADYYYNKIDGFVMNAKQAPSRGIPGNSISSNVGSMYNKGIEINLQAQIIRGKDFRWDANFNISTVKNKVIALAGNADIYTPSIFGIQNMTREGYSVGSVWAVPTAGVNPDNGFRIFINRNGDKVQYNHAGSSRWTYLDGTTAPAIDNYLDGKIQGPSLPTYYGGFNNTFTYKSFDLSLGITFSGGNKMYNGTKANLLDQRYFNNGTFVLDRWTTPKQVTDIPKLIYGDNVSTGFSITNSAMVEDGSFARLKTASLGYRIPVQNIFRGKISPMRVYFAATNLILITKYTGADPEISINGNSIDGGKDHNSTPNARVLTFGLNVGF